MSSENPTTPRPVTPSHLLTNEQIIERIERARAKSLADKPAPRSSRKLIRKLVTDIEGVIHEIEQFYTVPAIPGNHSPNRTRIHFCYPTLQYFKKHADGPGQISRYVNVLLALNPTPSHWQDNRSDELKSFDKIRMDRDRLPLWLTEETWTPTQPRELNLTAATRENLTRIARYKFIGKYQPRYDREVPSQSWLSDYIHQNFTMVPVPPVDTRLAGYVLECIATELLIPTVSPPYNPTPKRPRIPARSFSHPWPGHPI